MQDVNLSQWISTSEKFAKYFPQVGGESGGDREGGNTNMGNMAQSSRVFKNPNEAASTLSIPNESGSRSFAWKRKRKRSKKNWL